MTELKIFNRINCTDPNLEKFLHVFRDAQKRDRSRSRTDCITHIEYFVPTGWADMRDMNTAYVSEDDEKISVSGGGIHLIYNKMKQTVKIDIGAGWRFVRWIKTMPVQNFSSNILDEFEAFYGDIYTNLKAFNETFFDHKKSVGKIKPWFRDCSPQIVFENNDHVRITVYNDESLNFPLESYIKLEDFTKEKAREVLEMWDMWNATYRTEKSGLAAYTAIGKEITSPILQMKTAREGWDNCTLQSHKLIVKTGELQSPVFSLQKRKTANSRGLYQNINDALIRHSMPDESAIAFN